MEVDNEQNKTKIKNDLIAKDLSELLKALIIFFLVGGLCGYIGYIYSKDNNLSVTHGIIFGILFPLGVSLLELINCNNFFCFILYTIVYLAVVDFIPTFVGIIILLLVIGIFIIDFIYIEKQDRTKEIEEHLNYNKGNSTNTFDNNKYFEEESIGKYNSTKVEGSLTDNSEKAYYKQEAEEFECEVCFKKISEEEYELYDGMCEDCFMDVHIDNDGNYHDEELF